jgi:hypothetical protein
VNWDTGLLGWLMWDSLGLANKTPGKIFRKLKTIRIHEFFKFEKVSSENYNLKKVFL